MIDIPIDDTLQKVEWNDESRSLLNTFLHDVANTPLKIKILETFLRDPYLCLTSASLAQRLNASLRDVQTGVRELHASDSFLYCQSFAYSDLCCLSFDRLSPAMQHNLSVLNYALRHNPEAVWTS